MAKRYLTTADLAHMQAPPPAASSPTTSSGVTARRPGRGSPETVHSITSTPEAHSVDMGRRMKIYGVQMFLRVACFFGFVIIDNTWWRVLCVVGMVILPWSAVLLANAGADKTERTSNYLGPDLQPQLSAAADSDGSATSPSSRNRSRESPSSARSGQSAGAGQERFRTNDAGFAPHPGSSSDDAHPGASDVIEGVWSPHANSGRDR